MFEFERLTVILNNFPRIYVFVFHLRTLCRIVLAFVQNRSMSVWQSRSQHWHFFFASLRKKLLSIAKECATSGFRRNSLQLNEALEIHKALLLVSIDGENNFVFLRPLLYKAVIYHNRHFYDDSILELILS